MTEKPVLISGAGLSGLLPARSLRSSDIPCLLYERDPSIVARAQGYKIRISTDGLNSLKQVLSEAQFARFHSGTSTTGGGGVHSFDAITGEDSTFMDDTSPKGSQPTGPPRPTLGGDVLGVGRACLRQCLFEGMEDTVHWGKRSTGFQMDEEGVILQFADGTSSPIGSLFIAADGPQSTITKQLTDGKTPARALKQLGHGVFGVQDTSAGTEGLKLGFITNVRPSVDLDGDEELGWVFVGGPGSFDAPGGNFSLTGKVAADLSRELTSKWHQKFRTIFELQNDSEAAFLKMSTAHPEGIPVWTNSPRVTMLGDSVHCMTPSGGMGANTALKDAALLARLIGQTGGWRDGLTDEYEKEMRIYASQDEL